MKPIDDKPLTNARSSLRQSAIEKLTVQVFNTMLTGKVGG